MFPQPKNKPIIWGWFMALGLPHYHIPKELAGRRFNTAISPTGVRVSPTDIGIHTRFLRGKLANN